MNDNYQAVLKQSRSKFAEKEPWDMAYKGAACYQEYSPLSIRQIIIPFLGETYLVTWPEGKVYTWNKKAEAPLSPSLLILHYLYRADGNSPEGSWFSFKELWGGRSFDAAFKKRALDPLSSFFHTHPHLFPQAVKQMGGIEYPQYENSYFLFAFPSLPLLLTLYPGDEEVATRSNILYDSIANNYLETEDLAVLAEILSEYMINYASQLNKTTNI